MTPAEEHQQSVMRILGRLEGKFDAIDRKVDGIAEDVKGKASTAGVELLATRVTAVEEDLDQRDRDDAELRGRRSVVSGGVRGFVTIFAAPIAVSVVVGLLLNALVLTH